MTRSQFLGIWLAVIAVAILVPAGARADTIDSFVLTGAGGNPTGGGSNIADGVYLLPYYGTINGVTPPVPLVCDDYAHDVSLGQSWSIVENTLAGDLSLTRWDNATLYKEAFWLISQVSSNPTEIPGIQFAIWNLLDPVTANSPAGSGVPDEQYWLTAANTAAANNFYGMTFNDYVILTPVDPTTGLVSDVGQEYILVTPEPSAILMFGTGILGLLGIARRKLCM